MIRFVDLRGQDTGARFAFFDTVPDSWVELDDLGSTWQTWQEFEDAYCQTYACEAPDVREQLERFRDLAPDWTRTPETPITEGAEPCILCALSAQGWPHSGFSCCTREELVARLAGTP